MAQERIAQLQGLTFDDVLWNPAIARSCRRSRVGTQLTRRIQLNIPLLSSPMDTVTESEMAIALAQEGGIGVIHKNLPIERQAEEVEKVKRSANGIIATPPPSPPTPPSPAPAKSWTSTTSPGCPSPNRTGDWSASSRGGTCVFRRMGGIPISEVMTRKLVTATGNVTLEEAEKILMAKKVEKLLLVDEDFRLTGLITIKDIDMMRRYPQACKDGQGRLRVGAAVGVHDYERIRRA